MENADILKTPGDVCQGSVTLSAQKRRSQKVTVDQTQLTIDEPSPALYTNCHHTFQRKSPSLLAKVAPL